MKNLFESPETFEAYAIIDYCYYEIERINEELKQPLSPIEKAIDKQTGFDKARIKKYKEQTIDLIKEVIKCKKIIDADYSRDEKFLEEIKSI